MNSLLRRRLRSQTYAPSPLLCRPDRPRRKASATVGTHVGELFLGAVCAKGAFVRADARLGGCRRQVLVAIFAVGAEFENHVYEGMMVASSSLRRTDQRLNVRSYNLSATPQANFHGRRRWGRRLQLLPADGSEI